MIAKVLLVDPPSWFSLVWTIVRPVVQPALLHRVKTLSHKDLPAYIPRESIPISLRGMHEYDANRWLKSAGLLESGEQIEDGSPSEESTEEVGSPREKSESDGGTLPLLHSQTAGTRSLALSNPGTPKNEVVTPRGAPSLGGSHPTRVISKRPPVEFNIYAVPRNRDRADSISERGLLSTRDDNDRPEPPKSARLRSSRQQRSNSSTSLMYSSRESTIEE